jgi:FixJ family two-component response regulator
VSNAESDSIPSTRPKLRTARKVHVIDDDPSLCMVLERMLRDHGYDVATHTKARSDLLHEMTEADLLFIDMIMPGTNGLQVLDILAGNQIKSAVVLMSATNDVLATAQALAGLKGISLIGVLRKPFRDDALMKVLEDA